MTAPGRSNPRVLFADDEPQVLGALQNLFRRMRGTWDMVFVGSGAEALVALEQAAVPFDVLVTDMRMPGMDGLELLERVRDRFPSVARIILSGYAEPSVMAKATKLAHQFLSKPCNAELLKAAIQRACSMRRMLEDNGLRAFIGKLGSLPSPPAILSRLAAAVDDPDASLASIARIVEQDPATCAKVLQLVNSPYFGFGGVVESIEQAVIKLGLQQLRGVVLSAHVFFSLGAATDNWLIERTQIDAAITGRIARRLIQDPKQEERVFTAALVHDVGQIVLSNALPEEYRTVHREALKKERSFADLERAYFGATHAQVGGYLLGMWGLPAAIVDAVALHQEPQLIDPTSARLVAVLHAASSYVESVLEKMPIAQAQLDLAFLEKAGVSGELARWQGVAAEELASCSL